MSAGHVTGMPLMLLVYPCLAFARDYDPRDFARDGRLTADEARALFATRLRGAIEKLGIIAKDGGAPDERWYWPAPMLLDFAEFPAAARQWWNRDNLAQIWAGAEVGDEDAG